jgi:hypothetical protein
VQRAIIVLAPDHGTFPERKDLSGKGQLLSKENRWAPPRAKEGQLLSRENKCAPEDHKEASPQGLFGPRGIRIFSQCDC